MGPFILFLDFDGVLHPVRESDASTTSGLIGAQGKFVWLPILDDLLAPYPEVKIVVSSDQRCSFNDDELIELLGPLGQRFSGIVGNYDELSRAEEIRVEVACRGLNRWLSIDDHASVVDASHLEPRFIICEPGVGVSSPSVQAEIREKLSMLAGRPARHEGR